MPKNKFDEALAEGEIVYASFVEARESIESLTQAFNEAVARMTKEYVQIVLHESDLTLPGDNPVRLLTQATNEHSSERLWSLSIPLEGWPVTIRGPKPKQVIGCFDASELESALLNAASSALVMRKIKTLASELDE